MIKRTQYLRSQIMCAHSRRGWRARLSYLMMEDAKIELALQVAVTRLGFAEVKEKQKEAVVAFVSGKDVFVSLPTGYGKSLCYMCLPFLFDALSLKTDEALGVGAIIVVVTPLIAIMKEQSAMLTGKGVPAVHVVSSVDESVEVALLEGRFRVIFISPEQLLRKKRWRDMLRSEMYQKHLAAFVVDEAHCVKKW